MRQLRARTSDPAPLASPASHNDRSDTNGPLGRASERDLKMIRAKLAPENIAAKREGVIKGKEAELRIIVDEHDTAVKEKFHLERYTSIFEGWNPKDAKEDNSPVFLEYKRTHHNLLDLVPAIPAAPRAGPSRSRTSLPSRTTRRRATEQSELFAGESPAGPSTVNGTTASSVSGGTKTKGKGRASDVEVKQEELVKRNGRSRLESQADSPGSMLPPPVPVKSKGNSRRATIDPSAAQILPIEDVEQDEIQAPNGKGKKRGRQSLPNLPTKKLRNGQAEPASTGTASPSPSPAVEAEAVTAEPAPPPPPPPILPSLAHLPFPDPPHRPRERVRGPRKIIYTDYAQLPQGTPRYGGDIRPLLDSYAQLEDTGPVPDLPSLELRAAREAYFRNRVNYLQQQGRLLRLLDDDGDDSAVASTTGGKSGSINKAPTLPPRLTDYQDSLMAHMVQVRNAMLNEAKIKPLVCRRIAKMVQAHWDHIEGKEERERLAEERERKRQMKELVKALRKRWALAVKVVRAKLLQIQKEEQDRLGKEHLQNMLQRSTGLIEAHRDEFAGRDSDEEDDDGDDEDDDDDADDADSEDTGGTEDVSAAEDSEADQEDEEDGTAQPGDHTTGPDIDMQDVATPLETVGEGPANGDTALAADDIADQAATDPVNAVEGDDEFDPASDSAETDGDDLRALLLPNDGQPAEPEQATISEVARPAATPDVNTVASEAPAVTSGVDPIVPTSRPILEAPLNSDANGSVTPPQNPALTNGHAPMLNGHHAGDPRQSPGPSSPTPDAPPGGGQPDQLESEVAPRAPSTRKRKRTGFTGSVKVEEIDPYADDIDFKAEVASDQDEQDRDLDVEMEQDEIAGGSEDEGLLADADLPIEELLKRYGYEMPQPNGHADAAAEAKDEAKAETATAPADQSLTDEALAQSQAAAPDSPALVLEGKRQRRVRSVWSPKDIPQHLPNPNPRPKKPKIELVDGEEGVEVDGVSDDASTPKFTSSEDEDEDEDEDDEDADDEKKGDDDQDADPNRIRPPFLLRGTLRPYQHDGLEWLASLYANNMNGILADEMGLGKTIQTIALLAHLACDKGVWGQHLIIVPTSVILNWEMEFKKFLPGIKVLTYYGNQKERKEKRVGWQTQHHFQVCITSYQIVLADQHIFRRKNWVYMILDEAHNIKNFRSQRWQTLLGFKAQKRLLLTGTPLQNNLMELWSLLYFLMPGGVTEDRTSVVGFANHKEFTEWFSNPMDKAIETGDVIDEETLATVNKLHTLLRPFILRRLKSEVETQLPGKFEHVVHCRLSKRQRFLYDEFMSRASTKEALTSGGYLGVVNTLMQLRKVCNHPDLFEVRPVRTSFAMDPVAIDYEPTELLVRKRLLAQSDADPDIVGLDGGNLLITANEHLSAWTCQSRRTLDASHLLPHAIEPLTATGKKARAPQPPKLDTLTVEGWLKYRAWHEEQKSIARWRSLRDNNRRRCAVRPYYGSTLLDMLTDLPQPVHPLSLPSSRAQPFGEHAPPASSLVHSYAERASALEPLVNLYAVMPPNVVARGLATQALPGLTPSSHPLLTNPAFDTLHPSTVKLQIAFPDASLLQYDCGKLQTLYTMLRDLKAGGHRVLIFTQMTRVLDILEMFLSYNGHRYLRLDGSTKIEDRQIITERFNSDSRIFCFIASSRSGGVGINLTGADTVFFYDSDWNPSMDRQCMDRAHRIGQTREVHIYRFVSTHTVEENMLKKANQKRLLDKVVIQQGEFTTDFFGKMDWRDVLDTDTDGVGEAGARDLRGSAEEEQGRVEDLDDVEDEPMAADQDTLRPRLGEERELAKALAEVEDEEDADAAQVAQGEGEMDLDEFGAGVRDTKGALQAPAKRRVGFNPSAEGSGTPVTPAAHPADEDGEEEDEEDEEDDGIGGIDEYMLRLVEWDWTYFVNYRA